MEKSILQIPFAVLKRLRYYRKSQFRSAEELRAMQNEQLIRLIRYAGAHVPYYKQLFSEIDLDTATFKGIEDMHRIPTLDKETVRTRKEDLLSDQAKRYGITWDSTSGSTGTPLHFVLSNAIQANKIAALLRSFGWAGYRPGIRTLSVQSYYFKENDFQHNKLYNVIRFDSNRLQKESALKLIQYLHKKPPRFIIGFPFDIMMIAQFASDAGLSIPSPKSVITYGEKLSENRRQQIESLYKTTVFDFHSMHECSAMISQCEHGSLHLIEDFSFMEVEDGRLIGTSYYNYSMPLIRYKTRDLVSLEVGNCACGRPFRKVKEIQGKACDHIITPDGRILGAVMSHSVDQAKGVIVSQCVQDALDHITFRLVVDDQYSEVSQDALEQGLRKRIGSSMKIDFEIVDELEKTKGGKTPFIRSKIGNHYE